MLKRASAKRIMLDWLTKCKCLVKGGVDKIHRRFAKVQTLPALMILLLTVDSNSICPHF